MVSLSCLGHLHEVYERAYSDGGGGVIPYRACHVGVAETAPMGVVYSPDPNAANDCGVVVQVERAARASAARGRGVDVHSLF